MTTLFISDLHLQTTQLGVTAQLISLLRGEARQAEHVYILGDLFEFWVGDDDPDPTYAQIQHELRALTDNGVPCSVMHGNRDFLLSKRSPFLFQSHLYLNIFLLMQQECCWRVLYQGSVGQGRRGPQSWPWHGAGSSGRVKRLSRPSARS